MKRSGKLPELLAPAGDFDSLVAAVLGGADAVYVGGLRFGARAYAKNFDKDELSRAVEYCHLFGVKLYVTVNTLIFDKEMIEAVDFCRELYNIGVDAVIIADVGLMRVLRQVLPELELHASTQLSVHNSYGADEAYRLGASRVVLARELSLSDIRKTTERSLPEIEIFLHGALCVCHSGQCLFSSLVGGRSGNRGECAQPCRLPYNNGEYPISLKDLSLAGHIEELIDSGVSSLKIEGRMKSPEYVYTVTSIYRRLLDEGRSAAKDESALLYKAFSRGGFTDGYFTGSLGKMTGIRTADDKESSRRFAENIDITPKKKRVFADASFKLGERSSMTVYTEDKSFTAYGATPSIALTHALDKSELSGRLRKMGATPLSLAEDDLTLFVDDGINLSPGDINALRRAACEGFLTSARIAAPECSLPKSTYIKQTVGNTALFLDPTVLQDLPPQILSHFDIIFVPLMSGARIGEKYGVYIPPIVFEGELDEVKSALEKAKESGVMYALVSNISHIRLVKEAGLIPYGDFRLNITNSYARDAYSELGVTDTVLSAELTLPQARDIPGILIVYGRIPLMLTERCFMSEGGCKGACPDFALRDRRGSVFPIMREYKHRNLVLNSAVTYMADKREELEKNGKAAGHYIFSKESADQIVRVVESYRGGARAPSGVTVRRVGMRRHDDM